MYLTCIDFNDKNLKRIEIDDVVGGGGGENELKLRGIGSTRGQLPTIKRYHKQLEES